MATTQTPTVQLSRLEQTATPLTICVTGASGYIASAVVQRLLAAGHTVHGTVRDVAKKTDHLLALDGASERLKLFSADLLKDGSFDEAIAGCDAVIHIASPFMLAAPKGVSNNDAFIVPAVKGTENVYSSIAKTPLVKHVIHTSSTAAVYADNWDKGPESSYSEEDWNTRATADYLPYYASKALAERRAWEIYEQQGAEKRWRLVCINPSFVTGPPVGKIGATSLDIGIETLTGKYFPACANLHFGFVHIDDVAQAHVHALLKPEANGRYILAHGQRSYGLYEVMKANKSAFPEYTWPIFSAPKWVAWVFCKLMGMPFDGVASSINKVGLAS